MAQPSARKVGSRLLWRLLPVAAAVFVLLAADRGAQFWAEYRAIRELRNDAEAMASQRVAVLQSEIDKHRALPFVLTQDPDVVRALTSDDPAAIAKLNEKLAKLSKGTRAGVIYLLDRSGSAIAASNYNTPTSFTGNNYAFRLYYRRAMEAGSGEEFAFGTVSHKPGFYLSRRIGGPDGPLGVMVVKVEFDAIESQWHRFAEPILVVDDHGIVLVTSESSWRFMSMAPIPPDRKQELRNSLQFGDHLLDPLPIHAGKADGTVAVRLPRARSPTEFVTVSEAVPGTKWTLHLLAPTQATVPIATTAARSLAWLVGLVGVGSVTFLRVRYRNRREERARSEATRRELEERVKDRTVDLENANLRLRTEMEERQRNQTVIQQLQDELVQANKLTLLGQIAASVAHEINQPVAAIRTLAENGCILIERDDRAQASRNLSTIAGLTDRIGSITAELRAFARKSPGKIEPVSLRATIDGALLLVGHRLRQQDIGFSLEISDDIIVAADRVRLEQVFVNLLQNAIDALERRRDPQIRIQATATAEEASVTLSDNGEGLPETIMQSLFVPFATTKLTGLGLGLVISKDILCEFGGALAASNGAGGGALFVLTIPRCK